MPLLPAPGLGLSNTCTPKMLHQALTSGAYCIPSLACFSQSTLQGALSSVAASLSSVLFPDPLNAFSFFTQPSFLFNTQHPLPSAPHNGQSPPSALLLLCIAQPSYISPVPLNLPALSPPNSPWQFLLGDPRHMPNKNDS